MTNESPDSLPELPFTWKYAVVTPSSFEKALDEVVNKLSEMEDRASPKREEKGKENRRPAAEKRSRRPSTPRDKLRRAMELRQQRISEANSRGASPQPRLSPPTQLAKARAESLSAEDVTVNHEDRDICDRDVLKGLRMAISAACDEDLDMWLRGKTGLRLRRFLADLKTLEDFGEEDEDDEACPGSDEQRHRTRRAEKRRLEAEATKPSKQQQRGH